MALNTAAVNSLAGSLATLAPFLSLHSADPGANGTNATTAGRQAASWSAASGGVITAAANIPFTGGAANGAVTHVGLWSAASGGTFYGSQALTGDNTFNSSGQYTLVSFAETVL